VDLEAARRSVDKLRKKPVDWVECTKTPGKLQAKFSQRAQLQRIDQIRVCLSAMHDTHNNRLESEFISTSGWGGSAWMFASQRLPQNRLSWSETRTGICMNLGLPPPLPTGVCELCEHSLGRYPHTHAKRCKGLGNGYPHSIISSLLRGGFRAINADVPPGEPVLRRLVGWRKIGAKKPKKKRGDFLVRHGGIDVVVDVALTDSLEGLSWYENAGDAANVYAGVKRKEYEGWDISNGRLVPCCVEMYGGVNPDFVKFVDNLCEKSLVEPADKYKKRFIREAISIARIKGASYLFQGLRDGPT
jgi:hypothetical protein